MKKNGRPCIIRNESSAQGSSIFPFYSPPCKLVCLARFAHYTLMMALVSHQRARLNTSGSQMRSRPKLNYSTIINFLSNRVHDVWPVMRLKLSVLIGATMSDDSSRAASDHALNCRAWVRIREIRLASRRFSDNSTTNDQTSLLAGRVQYLFVSLLGFYWSSWIREIQFSLFPQRRQSTMK